MNIAVGFVGREDQMSRLGKDAVSGSGGLLKNYIKGREVLVVTVVRGGKVDIGYMMAADAAWRTVQALENPYCGNVWFGTLVQ